MILNLLVAASSTLALFLSPKFDLRKTYFLIAGIAGGNPYEVTSGVRPNPPHSSIIAVSDYIKPIERHFRRVRLQSYAPLFMTRFLIYLLQLLYPKRSAVSIGCPGNSCGLEYRVLGLRNYKTRRISNRIVIIAEFSFDVFTH